MGLIRVELRHGDITTVQADVCISSIHRSKDMTIGRLSKNLLVAGGKTIQDEMLKKSPNGDLNIGQVEAVSPGKCKNFKELLFVCLFTYRPGNEEILQQSTLECLELAAVKEYKSVAFPALGTGLDYPPEKVATLILESIAMHKYQYPESSLEVVHIVLLDQDRELMKLFLLMFMKGTTQLDVDSSSQSETVEGCGSDLFSGISLESALASEDPLPGTAKPRMAPKPQIPKTSIPRKTGSQKSSNPALSKLMSSFFSLFTNKGLSYQYGIITCNIQPKLSQNVIGAQLNFGIDVSLIAKYLPPQWQKSFTP